MSMAPLKKVYIIRLYGSNSYTPSYHQTHTFMRRPRGWPMPPAAPRMATFLSGLAVLLNLRSVARSICCDARSRVLMLPDGSPINSKYADDCKVVHNSECQGGASSSPRVNFLAPLSVTGSKIEGLCSRSSGSRRSAISAIAAFRVSSRCFKACEAV